MASPLLGGPTVMKKTTATVLALFTFFAAAYLLAITDTPGIGWRQ